MIIDDRYLIVRAASLYITVTLTGAVWLWRRPSSRAVSGGVLAFFWNLPVVLALHVAAQRYGWWRFEAHGGLLLGMPVDLYLAWSWLWSAVIAIGFAAWPLGVVLILALSADLLLMPAGSPVIELGPAWLVGETVGLLAGLIPGQLLARWTAKNERLAARALLQVLAFSGLVLFVVPAIVIEGTGSAWRNPAGRPGWQISLIVQALAAPALLGLSAVQEFVTRGGGTPVPFDPPQRLVTTGIYAYVRNPMQLSGVLVMILMGFVLHNVWVSAAGVMAHVYALGLAGWDEGEDLHRRFGDDWSVYRRGVRAWLPRHRPWFPADRPAARLFVAESCGMCRQVGEWFERRKALHLQIVAAETHPSGALTRITYEPGDGTRAATGVQALGRALEHVHLGWALLGCAMRLPVVFQLAQLVADASGGEPRPIGQRSPKQYSQPRVRR